MSIVTFLQRLATMQTGEELGGHMSGADVLSQFQQFLALASDHGLDAASLV